MVEAAQESIDELWCEGRWGELIPLTNTEWEAARTAGDLSGEADALGLLAFLYGEMGQAMEAFRASREELKLRRVLRDPLALAQTLQHLAWELGEAGRTSSSIRCLRQALAYRRILGDDREVFLCLANLGERLWECGQIQKARNIFEEALPKAAHGFPGWGRARVLESLSLLAESPAEALTLQHQFVQELCSLGREFDAGKAMLRLASLHVGEGQAWEARELLHAAMGAFQRLVLPEETEQAKVLTKTWHARSRGDARRGTLLRIPLRGRAH